MKNCFPIITMLMALTFNAFAQRQADWSTAIPDDANEIFYHTLTGVPIVRGDKFYAGIDRQKHAVSWTIQRSKGQAMTAAISGDEGLDYFEVDFTPFSVANNTLLDTRDGKILLDKEKNGFKKIEDYEILDDLNALLFKTIDNDGFVKLHLLDKKTGQLRWSASTVKSGGGGLGGMVKSDDAPPPPTRIADGTTFLAKDNSLLIFQYKKETVVLQAADGKMLWKEKFDPARVFFTADEKTAFFVEHDKGGLIAQALTVGGKRMGNEVTAVDLSTGKPVWKKPLEAEGDIRWYEVRGDKILLVHANGCNFYNQADGKPVWKDDFEAKRIYDLVENTEGYLAYYGYYKTMQLDKNGQKLWKKPQILPEAEEDEEMDDNTDFVKYPYDKGVLILTPGSLRFKPNKGSDLKNFAIPLSPTTRIEYDEKRKIFVILDNKGITLINPDKYPKGAITRRIKTDPSNIIFVEMRPNTYYFSGNEHFIIIKPDESEAIERHYKEPFDRKAFLTGALAAGVGIGSAAMVTAGTVRTMKGSGELLAGTMNQNDKMADQGAKNVQKGTNQMSAGNALAEASAFVEPSRHVAFSQTRDFAYFFTKDKKADEKVLIKLNKDTGEEVDKLIFDDARPLYKVDEVEDFILYANKKTVKAFERKK